MFDDVLVPWVVESFEKSPFSTLFSTINTEISNFSVGMSEKSAQNMLF